VDLQEKGKDEAYSSPGAATRHQDKYLIFIHLVKKFPAFMEPESSSSYSQNPVIRPYHKPAESGSHLHALLLLKSILMSTSHISRCYGDHIAGCR
jgi:hypothetical protein